MGLSFVCDYPHYLSPDQIIQFQINNIIFKGQIKHVSCCHSQWKYGVEITSFLPSRSIFIFYMIENQHYLRGYPKTIVSLTSYPIILFDVLKKA